jgi:hypothetical protein
MDRVDARRMFALFAMSHQGPVSTVGYSCGAVLNNNAPMHKRLLRSSVEVKPAGDEPLIGERLLSLRLWLDSPDTPTVQAAVYMTPQDAEALIDMLRLSIVRLRASHN